MASQEPGLELPAEVSEGLDSVKFWGDNPVPIHLLLWSVARKANPNALWISLLTPAELSPLDPIALGWVKPDHVRFAKPESFDTPRTLPILSVLEMVQADEPQQRITLLFDFLNLPQSLQEFITEVPTLGRNPVLVVESSERLAPYLPLDAAWATSMLRVFRENGVKVLMSYIGPPRSDRFAFDHVYRFHTPAAGDWREGTIVREQGVRVPPFEMGSEVPLARLDAFRYILGRLA
jgi:hypothetical protein